uniref:Uncharacterized protein n=1 Tax=Ditylenchus dipsaci TaxID=166011 RepID=A0A915DY97_9BILA
MKAQNLTLWISPIEFSRSREETVPELIDMKSRWKCLKTCCCILLLGFLNEEDKHNNKQLFEEFMETVEENFLSSTHARPFTLHIDCFLDMKKHFPE